LIGMTDPATDTTFANNYSIPLYTTLTFFHVSYSSDSPVMTDNFCLSSYRSNTTSPM